MGELLTGFYTADRFGSALAFLAVAGIFAAVRHSERLRPVKERPDDHRHS